MTSNDLTPELARITRMLSVPQGRATITISNPRGGHATFKIKHAKGKYEGRTFVEIQDESAQWGWRSVGEIATSGTRGGERLQSYRGCSEQLAYAIGLVIAALGKHADDDYLTTVRGGPYTVQAADTCGACGRELTHPDSIPVGIGPECSAKLGGNHPGYSSTHVRTGKKAS